MIYVLSLIPFVIGSFMDLKKEKSAFYYWYVLLTFMFLVCFWGMRYYTGADWYGYLSYYHSANKGNTYGIGFKILNILSEKLFHSYYPVQFFSACVLLLGIYKVVFRHSKCPFLCVLVFCVWYYSLFLQVRQALAVGIVLLGLDFFLEKRHLYFLSCVAFASTFHSTAVILLLLYAGMVRISKKVKLLALCCCAILILYPSLVYSLYCKMVDTVLNLFILPSKITGKLIAYKNPIWWDVSQGSGAGVVFRVLLVFLATIVSTNNNSEDMHIFGNIAIFCVLFHAMGGQTVRIASYFGLFMIIYIMHAFDRMPSDKKIAKSLLLSPLLILVMMLWVKFFLGNSTISNLNNRPATYQYIPYYNVLNSPSEAKFRKDWNEP